MVRVDIVFDRYNSQLQVIRGRVLRAFLKMGIEPHWHEWDLRQKNLPGAIAVQSSLAVLINGVDVLGVQSTKLESLFRFIGFFDGGADNLPSVVKISQVMKSSHEEVNKGNQSRLNHWLPLTVMPIILMAFFFDDICSVCGAQLAGVPMASSVADFRHVLGFVMPALLLTLFFAISGFIYRAKERFGYKPLIVGLFFILILFYGRFMVSSDLLFWVGVSGVCGASLWNGFLRPPTMLDVCPRCPSTHASCEVGHQGVTPSSPSMAQNTLVQGAVVMQRVLH
ncbi:MAG: hypothetical protein JKY01_03560 [Pseudomonadales bacterium]|nr:hypothetical protein [Pseudomonadales bacterium]